MRFRRLPVLGPSGQTLRLVMLAGVAVSILAVGTSVSTVDGPVLEPVQDSMWKKRIRRLKLADPESTEEMLASAGTARGMPPLRLMA